LRPIVYYQCRAHRLGQRRNSLRMRNALIGRSRQTCS
jgi:hypothetical protein